MPRDDCDLEASRLDLLKRIAETLDMPTRALFGLEKTAVDRPADDLRAEARAMLSAFVRIRDPERRRACLGHVKAVANGEVDPLDARSPDRDDR